MIIIFNDVIKNKKNDFVFFKFVNGYNQGFKRWHTVPTTCSSWAPSGGKWVNMIFSMII